MRLPHKRPEWSKLNRHPRLTKIQQRANRHHSSIRVLVEHAIAGMESFNCLTHRIQNQSSSRIDHFFSIAGGLWN
ncbi:transposase family protein [Thiocapsa imhoffii]|uniref:transposase family protein n=1 Tax=Thiocapsa imhoffii TaxID=382777 RepID=UPI0035304893